MNIRSKPRILSLVAAMLCLILLFQAPASAAAELDFGTGSDSDETMSASALFDALFQGDEAPLSDAEREALDALSGVALTYNRNIPDRLIERDYDGSLGILTVRVKPYEYVASNGKTVSWIPTALSLDGGDKIALTASADGSVYTCSFSDLWHSDEIRLDVDFVWQVEIPVETANGLLTLPYTVGKNAADRLASYQIAADQYDREQAAFDAYREQADAYEIAKKAFDDYNEALKIYREKKSAYDQYLIDKAAYDQAYKEYEAYLEKKAVYDKAEAEYYYYESFRQKYESIYDAYEPYLKGLEAALSRISIMESMFLYDSHGWQFYSGVMGSTVDSVLQNRHELVSIGGVKAVYVDNANAATAALRPLLRGYLEVRSASYQTKLARYRAEFDYYAENYEEIRDNLTKLYQSIYAIYGYSIVSTTMNAKFPEKVPHFRQFLAQLYVLHCALDDTVTPDPNWTVSKSYPYTVAQLVEEPLLFPDGIVASPSGVSLPETEVVLPDEDFPEPVEKPVKDFTDLDEPTAPTEIKDPGNEPTKVNDPGDPPTEVFPPEGDRPVAPTFTDLEARLMEELAAGELTPREPREQAQSLTLGKTVSCIRYISNKKTVSFYDLNGTKLEQISVEYGTAATAPNMSRAPDERYLYTFLGWIPLGESGNAELVNLQCITEDLSLYPSYKKEDRKYKITWVVDTAQRVEYYLWNELPSCPISTDRYSDTVTYVFTGWSPEVTAVRKDAIYTAQYRIEERKYTVTWVVGDRTETASYKEGETPVCPIGTDRAPDSHLHVFTGWNRPVRPVTHNVTYIAQYKSTPLGISDDATVCEVTHTDTAVILHAARSTVNFATAAELASAQSKDLLLVWDEFTVTLTPDRIKALTNSYCVKIELIRSEDAPTESTRFRFRLLNSIGGEVCKNQKISLSISYVPRADVTTMVYLVSGNTEKAVSVTRYSEGRAELSVTNGAQMLLRNEYKLQYLDPTENCNLASLPTQMPIGATVDLNANCTYGYEISSAKLVFTDGTEQTVTEKSFVMPASAVSVKLTVTRIVYRIRFVVDGTVIYEETKFFGEEVNIPADPSKAEDDSYFYTFTGWTPYVTRATGEDRTPTYTASFTRTAKELPAPPVDEGPKGFFASPIVVLAVCLLAVGVLGLIAFLLRRQIKRLFVSLTARFRVNGHDAEKDSAVTKSTETEETTEAEKTTDSE